MTASTMPADQFWKIIERAARSDHDPDAHMEQTCPLTSPAFSKATGKVLHPPH
jgi:hypothetical protein